MKKTAKIHCSTSVGGYNTDIHVCEILTVQCQVTPKCAGASGSKINDNRVSTLKQAYSGRYSGSLKFSSRRFKHTQNQSASFSTLFSITPEINVSGWYRAVIRTNLV